jgi:hypothetical protein
MVYATNPKLPGRVGAAWARRAAFDGSHQGGLFAANKRPGAFVYVQVEAEITAQDIITQQPVGLARLGNGGF